MTIKILTLEDCSRCAKFKVLLKNNAIKFIDLPCNSNDEDCDRAEAVINSISYPIAEIQYENEPDEMLYLTDDYSVLQNGVKINHGIKAIPFHSIDNIVNYIKNKLNS